ERAQFLAIRQALAIQWQPRGGVEWQLLDAMALAQSGWLYWLQALGRGASLGGEGVGRESEDRWGRAAARPAAPGGIEGAGAQEPGQEEWESHGKDPAGKGAERPAFPLAAKRSPRPRGQRGARAGPVERRR